jgi:hypothetical protein
VTVILKYYVLFGRSLYLLLGAIKEYDAWKSQIEEVAFTNNNILSGNKNL